MSLDTDHNGFQQWNYHFVFQTTKFNLGLEGILDFSRAPVYHYLIVWGCLCLFRFYLHCKTTHLPLDADKKSRSRIFLIFSHGREQWNNNFTLRWDKTQRWKWGYFCFFTFGEHCKYLNDLGNDKNRGLALGQDDIFMHGFFRYYHRLQGCFGNFIFFNFFWNNCKRVCLTLQQFSLVRAMQAARAMSFGVWKMSNRHVLRYATIFSSP